MSMVVVPWFPNNLARNSLARLSNIEIRSLELQRLWRLLNCQANELRAKFPGRGRGAGSGLPRRSGRGGVVGRWSPENLCGKRGDQGNCPSVARRISDVGVALDMVVTVRLKHYI